MDPNEKKAPPDGMAIPPMLEEMMEKMCRGGGCDPAAMCQEMMGSVSKTAGTAAHARPEAETVFAPCA